jgi:hypothetical protein
MGQKKRQTPAEIQLEEAQAESRAYCAVIEALAPLDNDIQVRVLSAVGLRLNPARAVGSGSGPIPPRKDTGPSARVDRKDWFSKPCDANFGAESLDEQAARGGAGPMPTTKSADRSPWVSPGSPDE